MSNIVIPESDGETADVCMSGDSNQHEQTDDDTRHAGGVSALRKALRNYYNESEHYLSAMQSHDDHYFGSYLDWVAHHLKTLVGPQGTLIDIGCGGGATTHAFATRLSGYHCTGLDISEPAMAFARRRYRAANLDYRSADCLALPFADASLDAVVSRDLIEHLPDVPRALDEMIRVLRPRGVVLIRSPHHRSPLFALQDLLRFRRNYPFVRSGFGNLPRFLMLSADFLFKLGRREPRFHYRTPDLTDTVAVGHDADAVYEVCSLDLLTFFKSRGFAVHNVGAAHREGRSSRMLVRWLPCLASIGLVAQKAESGGRR